MAQNSNEALAELA
ncbi:unnamed protein product, partial [Rotaria sp. Silwood2]